jgi:hypothetical protein
MFASDFELALVGDSGAFATLADRVASLATRDPQSATVLSWAAVHGMAMLSLDGRLPKLGPDGERRAVTLLATSL